MKLSEVPEFKIQAKEQEEDTLKNQVKLLQEQVIELEKKVAWLEKTTSRKVK